MVVDPGDDGYTLSGTTLSVIADGDFTTPTCLTWQDGYLWEHLGLAETRYIARVVVDPTDGDRIFVAATGQLFGADPHRGVFRSVDSYGYSVVKLQRFGTIQVLLIFLSILSLEPCFHLAVPQPVL